MKIKELIEELSKHNEDENVFIHFDGKDLEIQDTSQNREGVWIEVWYK